MKRTTKLLAALTALILIICCTAAVPRIYQREIPADSRLVILMYHHVVPDGETTNSISITAGKLEKDLQYLCENGYSTVLPSELLGGPLPDKAVMITFDDGYRSNYELAYPLLKQYGCKAAIALITANLDAGMEMFLEWDMCREMADSGLIEFGSHTDDLHNPENSGELVHKGPNGIQPRKGEKTGAYKERIAADLEQSRGRISEETGRVPVFFAYPYGATDRAGNNVVDGIFPVSVITVPGYTDIRGGTARMPRFGVRQDTDLASIIR